MQAHHDSQPDFFLVFFSSSLKYDTHYLLAENGKVLNFVSLAERKEDENLLFLFHFLWRKTFFHKLAFQLVKSFEVGKSNGQQFNRRFKFDFWRKK